MVTEIFPEPSQDYSHRWPAFHKVTEIVSEPFQDSQIIAKSSPNSSRAFPRLPESLQAVIKVNEIVREPSRNYPNYCQAIHKHIKIVPEPSRDSGIIVEPSVRLPKSFPNLPEISHIVAQPSTSYRNGSQAFRRFRNYCQTFPKVSEIVSGPSRD